jgi:hypothetical protein
VPPFAENAWILESAKNSLPYSEAGSIREGYHGGLVLSRFCEEPPSDPPLCGSPKTRPKIRERRPNRTSIATMEYLLRDLNLSQSTYMFEGEEEEVALVEELSRDSEYNVEAARIVTNPTQIYVGRILIPCDNG